MNPATSERNQNLIGAILRAVACTPNKNIIREDYEVNVVDRVRRIRALEASLNGRLLTHEECLDLVQELRVVLETKQVSLQEREERVSEVARLFGLQ